MRWSERMEWVAYIYVHSISLSWCVLYRKNGRVLNQRRMLSTLWRVFICSAFVKTNFISLLYSGISQSKTHLRRETVSEWEKHILKGIGAPTAASAAAERTKTKSTHWFAYSHVLFECLRFSDNKMALVDDRILQTTKFMSVYECALAFVLRIK